MKRLLLLCGLLAALLVPSALADATYGGTASALKPFAFSVTSAGGTFTASASFVANQGGGWQGQGYTLTISDASGSICRSDGLASPLSCTVADSVAGVYQVSFWPTKGKAIAVSITVSGPA